MANMANGLKAVHLRAVSYLQSPYAFAAAAVAVGLLIAATTLAASHPALGEIVESVIITAGGYLLAVGLFAFGSFIAYNFARSSARVWKEDVLPFAVDSVKQIGAGAVEPLPFAVDISPDIIVVGAPGESKEAIAARLESAREHITPSRWVVYIEYRNPVAAIYTHGGAPDIVFTREDAPFQHDGFARIVPESARFVDETPEMFAEYLSRFAFVFREWSPRKKVAADQGRAGRTVLDIVNPSLALFFAFFALPSFAQNAAQVSDALGTRIREIPAAGSEVLYEFETKEFSRVGDGRKDYVTLLKSAPMYRDNRGGRFVALYLNGRPVVKGEQVQAVAERDAMRPRTFTRTDEPVSYGLPDSLGMADMAEQVRYEIWKATEAAGQGVRPWWSVVMFALWRVFPFLIVALGVTWLFAGVCAKEGMYTLHKQSRRAFAVILLGVAAILLTNFLLMAVAAGFGPLGLTLVAAAETFAAYKIVTWLVPDFRPALGNEPRRQGSYYDTPQLPG